MVKFISVICGIVGLSNLALAFDEKLVCDSRGTAFKQVTISIAEGDSSEVGATVQLKLADQTVRAFSGTFGADVLQIRKNTSAKYATSVFGRASKRETDGVYVDSGLILLRNDAGRLSMQLAVDGFLYYANCK